jgi:hypothetical protein
MSADFRGPGGINLIIQQVKEFLGRRAGFPRHGGGSGRFAGRGGRFRAICKKERVEPGDITLSCAELS